MRVAVSGTHGSGKTTLVKELQQRLEAHAIFDEPYWSLAEEGHVFAAMPSVEDFQLQFDRAVEMIAQSGGDSIFDRCPADILAYLLTHRDAEAFDRATWLSRCGDAMEELDLVVYVPIEEPDCIDLAKVSHPGLRVMVDDELREILLGGRLGLGVETLEVMGTPSRRATQVVAHLNGM